MKLSDLPPSTKVRLHFVNEQDATKTGTLVTTVEHALNPNRSGRFWPPEGVTPVQMNWPVPWWYSHEAVNFEVL